MARQKILLPYNFTPWDQKALDFLIRTFAHREDVEVTLFNSYTPAPEIDTQESQVMAKMKSNVNYLYQKINEQKAGLEEISASLLQNGFQENQVRSLFRPRKKDVAGEIIELVQSSGFNVVILNNKPGRITRFFTGNVNTKIISALTDTVVCVVS